MRASFFSRYVLLFLLLGVAGMLRAQQFSPGGMPANGGAMPTAHVFGKITDQQGKAIAGASVLALQGKMDTVSHTLKNKLLKAQTTRGNGLFSFEDLPLGGPLTIKVSVTGMQEKEIAVSVGPPPGDSAHAAKGAGSLPAGMPPAGGMFPASPEKDLGTITLEPSANQLQSVTVSASRSMLKLDMDKKVFNVEKNIVSTGGTALDVMRNVPSVNVDIDGNVTMRNSTPQLYIDGRPTTLTLDQIPADAIDNVEIITNPSAKYDASGGGSGILNIVLKKNRKTGYNGNVRAGIDKRGGINAGGDINLRQGKFNLTASVMSNQMRDRTKGSTQRENLQDNPLTNVLQTSYDKNKGGFQFAKLGADYFLNDKTTISLTGIKVHGVFSPNSVLNTQTDSLYSTPVSAYSIRNSSTRRVFNANGLQFGFKQLFKKEGEQLTADANYFGGHNTSNALYVTDNLSAPGGSVLGTQQQQTVGAGTDHFLTLQTDYVKPFNDKTKLEAGLRASLQHLENDNDNYLLDAATGKYNKLAYASTNYSNNNNVYAAYMSFTSAIKSFGYQVGLRAERSNYNGELLNTGEHFGNKYPVSLFPSVFLSEKLKGNQELQLSVTRRVNRPNFFQLIPYTDYSDSLNITRGNPALVPEFTQSYEFSYMKTFKGNNTLLFSAYYKRTNHLITRYLDTATNPVSQKLDIVNTYINASSSNTEGLEVTSQNYLNKWWDISTNLNFYHSQINATEATASTVQQAMWSWFGKFNSNFKLPAKITLQLTATYQSKSNLPVNDNKGGMGGGPPGATSQSASQGYIKPFYGVDFAIRKNFGKNDAASISLSISDIFRTRKNEQYSESAYFIQDYSRLRDPQMIRLNLSWRFGKIDAQLFKRKNAGHGDQDAMQGMQ